MIDQPQPIRRPGWYWVRVPVDSDSIAGEWRPAHWTGDSWSTEYQHEVEEVDERPVIRPKPPTIHRPRFSMIQK